MSKVKLMLTWLLRIMENTRADAVFVPLTPGDRDEMHAFTRAEVQALITREDCCDLCEMGKTDALSKRGLSMMTLCSKCLEHWVGSQTVVATGS